MARKGLNFLHNMRAHGFAYSVLWLYIILVAAFSITYFSNGTLECHGVGTGHNTTSHHTTHTQGQPVMLSTHQCNVPHLGADDDNPF